MGLDAPGDRGNDAAEILQHAAAQNSDPDPETHRIGVLNSFMHRTMRTIAKTPGLRQACLRGPWGDRRIACLVYADWLDEHGGDGGAFREYVASRDRYGTLEDVAEALRGSSAVTSVKISGDRLTFSRAFNQSHTRVRGVLQAILDGGFSWTQSDNFRYVMAEDPPIPLSREFRVESKSGLFFGRFASLSDARRAQSWAEREGLVGERTWEVKADDAYTQGQRTRWQEEASRNVRTRRDAVTRVRRWVEIIGPGMHPDNAGDDYIILDPNFDAAAYDEDMEFSRRVLGENLYTVALQEMRRLGTDGGAEDFGRLEPL